MDGKPPLDYSRFRSANAIAQHVTSIAELGSGTDSLELTAPPAAPGAVCPKRARQKL
jgi:hypothetical protein